jgi:hypothetical protein
MGSLSDARASMERRGTVGAFTASSKKAGQSVQEHASSVLSDPHASTTQKKRAQFAKNMKALAAKRKG